jgi:hypothetical protein
MIASGIRSDAKLCGLKGGLGVEFATCAKDHFPVTGAVMCTFFGALGALGGAGQYFIGGGASLEGPALDDEAAFTALGAVISFGTTSIGTNTGGGGSADGGGACGGGTRLPKLGQKVPEALSFLFP